MTTPHRLVIIAATTQQRTKKGDLTGEPETIHHAAHPDDTSQAICGKLASDSKRVAVLDWATIPISKPDPQNHGEVIIVAERWPKHWRSTDDRNPCQRCRDAAELMWRRVDHQPNQRLADAGQQALADAKLVTPLLAGWRDELSSIGYPTTGEAGGGGYADQTGAFVARAHDLTERIEAMRDLISDHIETGARLHAFLERYRPKDTSDTKPNRGTCGSAQKAMTDEEREGWTVDLLCASLGVRANGLCHRCGMRYDRRAKAA